MNLKREFHITQDVGFSFLWFHAGLVSFWFGDWTVHVCVPPTFWVWGKRVRHFESLTLVDYGLGPFVLICR